MKKKYNTGLIVGKFYPLHAGHQSLIETGLSMAKRLVVIVYELSDHKISGQIRAEWIRKQYPAVEVQVRNCDRINPNGSQLWAGLAIGWLGEIPDVVFTSEEYGRPWAEAIGCDHVLVDQNRERIPISGTQIRQDWKKNWQYLSEPAREYFMNHREELV